MTDTTIPLLELLHNRNPIVKGERIRESLKI